MLIHTICYPVCPIAHVHTLVSLVSVQAHSRIFMQLSLLPNTTLATLRDTVTLYPHKQRYQGCNGLAKVCRGRHSPTDSLNRDDRDDEKDNDTLLGEK